VAAYIIKDGPDGACENIAIKDSAEIGDVACVEDYMRLEAGLPAQNFPGGLSEVSRRIGHGKTCLQPRCPAHTS
jgi:hypothetical protein